MAATGVDVDDAITNYAGMFMKIELDRQMINMVRTSAGAVDSDLGFDCSLTGLTGVTRRDKFADFLLKLSTGSNKIFTAAGRGEVSWIIAGTDVTTVIEACPGFIRDSNIVPIGAHIIGTLNGTTTIIKDPGLPSTEYLIGFNGVLVGDAGIIVGMFIPVFFTPTLVTPDLKGGKALLSMYDVIVNNSAYYKRGVITNF